MKKYIMLIAIICCLQACSSGISGTYSAQSLIGNYSFRFEKNGKVYVSAMGVESEAEYEKDGNKIKIDGKGGNMILTMINDETIQGPGGTTLYKQ